MSCEKRGSESSHSVDDIKVPLSPSIENSYLFPPSRLPVKESTGEQEKSKVILKTDNSSFKPVSLKKKVKSNKRRKKW
jgi:hypothetical protein